VLRDYAVGRVLGRLWDTEEEEEHRCVPVLLAMPPGQLAAATSRKAGVNELYLHIHKGQRECTVSNEES